MSAYIRFLIQFVLPVLLLFAGTGTAQIRSPYPCAVQAVRALNNNFPAFVRLVHPSRGVVLTEAGADVNDGRPVSRTLLLANRRIPVTRFYSDSDSAEPTPVRWYLEQVVRKGAFHKTADIRRNITSLPNSTDRFHTAEPGETLISFYIADPVNELGWRCLVVRMRSVGKTSYVTGIDALYWTP